jgi:hypothetical protein
MAGTIQTDGSTEIRGAPAPDALQQEGITTLTVVKILLDDTRQVFKQGVYGFASLNNRTEKILWANDDTTTIRVVPDYEWEANTMGSVPTVVIDCSGSSWEHPSFGGQADSSAAMHREAFEPDIAVVIQAKATIKVYGPAVEEVYALIWEIASAIAAASNLYTRAEDYDFDRFQIQGTSKVKRFPEREGIWAGSISIGCQWSTQWSVPVQGAVLPEIITTTEVVSLDTES